MFQNLSFVVKKYVSSNLLIDKLKNMTNSYEIKDKNKVIAASEDIINCIKFPENNFENMSLGQAFFHIADVQYHEKNYASAKKNAITH